MRSSKTSLMLTSGLAVALSFSICACSFNSSSTTSVSTEVTSEDGTTEKNSAEMSTSVGTDGVSASTSSSSSTIIDIADWESGWIGTSTTGETIFYAESPEGGAQGVLVFYNPTTKAIESYVGTNSSADGVYVTTTDAGNGAGYTFKIGEQNGDGVVELIFDEDHGTATLQQVAMDEFISQLTAVDTEGKVIE